MKLSAKMVYVRLKQFTCSHYLEFSIANVPELLAEVVERKKIMYLFVASEQFQIRYAKNVDAYKALANIDLPHYPLLHLRESEFALFHQEQEKKS